MRRWFLMLLIPLGLGVCARAQTPAEIMQLQAELRFIGYRIDAINGIYGPQTRQAVEAFEFSMGTGNEGRLNAGERAMLSAQVAATAFEAFGYRLRGYWTPLPCEEDPDLAEGIWMDDLAWLATDTQSHPLVETILTEPLVVTWEGRQESLTSSYLSAVNSGADIRFFPLDGRVLVVAGQQVFSLNQCATDLSLRNRETESQLIDLPQVELEAVN